MQAQAVTFDTHAFVKRLIRAGMPEDQAEILANGQSDLYERLVTKEYFQFTLKHELEKLRALIHFLVDVMLLFARGDKVACPIQASLVSRSMPLQAYQ